VNGSPELLHQAFAPAAAAAAAKPQRQGDLIAIEGGETYIIAMDGVSLQLKVTKPQNRWIVAAARHDGAMPPLSGVLDVFCQEIEGKPLQEAADHGAIYALERLRGDALARPVPGILTPRSAGSAFTCCEKLIRSIMAEHSRKTGDRDIANFWNPPISAEWRAKSDAERIAALQVITSKFSAARGLTPDALRISEIDKTRRVVVEFGPEISYLDKPELLMRLEMDIRQTTGDRLELFMAEAKDSNTIRRLTPDEEAAK
jgi:hypothetical protein